MSIISIPARAHTHPTKHTPRTAYVSGNQLNHGGKHTSRSLAHPNECGPSLAEVKGNKHTAVVTRNNSWARGGAVCTSSMQNAGSYFFRLKINMRKVTLSGHPRKKSEQRNIDNTNTQEEQRMPGTEYASMQMPNATQAHRLCIICVSTYLQNNDKKRLPQTPRSINLPPIHRATRDLKQTTHLECTLLPCPLIEPPLA